MAKANGQVVERTNGAAAAVDVLTGEIREDEGAESAVTITTLNRFAEQRRRIDRLRNLVEERKLVLIAQDDEGAKWLEELAILETANDAVEEALRHWARTVGKASIETEAIRVTAWHKTRWVGPTTWEIFEQHREIADELGLHPVEGEAQLKITLR